jgi:hypothetical protein
VFAGIPLAVVAVIVGLVYAGGGRSNDRRYRPGRPFEFTPVWFLSAPESQNDHLPAGGAGADGRSIAVSGANRMALAKADSQAAVPVGDMTGGASDRW